VSQVWMRERTDSHGSKTNFIGPGTRGGLVKKKTLPCRRGGGTRPTRGDICLVGGMSSCANKGTKRGGGGHWKGREERAP